MASNKWTAGEQAGWNKGTSHFITKTHIDDANQKAELGEVHHSA